ncbi:DUF4214 domain-containing protein [Massilia sp. CFBP9012]|uniref:DUF4214 domain-containing protein n=1 Tax=Massilia sp. CFBP9012 TaxID=3096531 RepID=UPI002A6B0201|nr:DUF4214 domain-containing protein [Massilia sp. CFBP9012]MDY0978186.1 DUF4214 domain-containing protein [Massilia sp. CFBP9012]
MSTLSIHDSTVNSFYLAFYGRPADPAGLKFWSQQLAANNGDLGAITQAFAVSEEAQVRFGTDSLGDRIGEIYQQLFNRTMDADGLAYWTDVVEQGNASLADVSIAILNGARGSDATLSALRQQAVDEFTAQVEATGSQYAGYASIEAARILVRAVTADATTTDLVQLVKAAVSFADTATKTPQVVEAIAVNTTLLALFDTTRGKGDPVALAQALADTAKAAAGDPVTLESLLRGGGMDKVLKVMPAAASLKDVVKALAEGGLPAAVEVVYPTAPTAPGTPAPAGMKLSFDSIDQSEQDHVLDNTTNLAYANVKFKYTGPDLVKGQHFEYSIDGGASWIDQGMLEDTVANTVTIQELYLGGKGHATLVGNVSTQELITPANVTTKIQLRAMEGDRQLAGVTKEVVFDSAAPNASLVFVGIDGKDSGNTTTATVVNVDFALTGELGAGDFVEYRMQGSQAWIALDSRYVKDGSVTIPGVDLSKADQTVQVRVTDNAGNANEFVATLIDGPAGVVLPPNVLVVPRSDGLIVGSTLEGTSKLVDGNKSTTLTAVQAPNEGGFVVYTVGEQETGAKGTFEFTPTGGAPVTPPQIAGYVLNLGTKAADTISGSVVWGFGGDDVIIGIGSKTNLFGGEGNDTITGGAGRDLIIGGKGGDLIDLGTDEVSDTVQYELGDADVPFVDNTSTAAIDKISNFGVGDELRIDIMFGQTPVLRTDYLSAGGNPNEYAIVRGSDDGGVFIKGASASDDDYMVQWSSGGKVNSTILHNFGTTTPNLFAYSGGSTFALKPVINAQFDDLYLNLAAGTSLADIRLKDGYITNIANLDTFRLEDFSTGVAKALPGYDALPGMEKIQQGSTLEFKTALSAGLFKMSWANDTFQTTNGFVNADEVYFAGGENGTFSHRGFVLDKAPEIVNSDVARDDSLGNDGFITNAMGPVRIDTGAGNDVIVDQGSDVTVVYDRIDDRAQDLIFGFDKGDTVLLDGALAAALRKDNNDDIAWVHEGEDIFATTEGATVTVNGYVTIGTPYGGWGPYSGNLFEELNLKLNVDNIALNEHLLILANGDRGDSNVLFLYQNMDNNGKIDASELTTIAMFADGMISTGNIELVGTQIGGGIEG